MGAKDRYTPPPVLTPMTDISCTLCMCLLLCKNTFLNVLYSKYFTVILRQKACVIWNSVKSDILKFFNGVKYVVLFNMYIDPLLDELSKSSYGRHRALCLPMFIRLVSLLDSFLY